MPNSRHSTPDHAHPVQAQSKFARAWAQHRTAHYPSSALPLLLLYIALVVYASLYPFDNWEDIGIAPFAYLSAPWPSYWSQFDVIANALGYMPIGFLCAFLLLRRNTGSTWPKYVFALLLGTAVGTALSLGLEALQTFLPNRIPSLADLLLNAGGACAGTLVALILQFVGIISRWSHFRNDWVDARSRWALVLLVLWPPALLIPSMIPFGLGHVYERIERFAVSALRDTQFLQYIPQRNFDLQPMHEHVHALSVGLSLLIPCLLAFIAIRLPSRRPIVLVFWVAIGCAVLTLSWALSYGPDHATDWIMSKNLYGVVGAVIIAALCSRLSAALNAGICWVALLFNLILINSTGMTTYYLLTLQLWEQGKFVRFYGLAQWVGWAWPFLVLIAIPWYMLRSRHRHDDGK